MDRYICVSARDFALGALQFTHKVQGNSHSTVATDVPLHHPFATSVVLANGFNFSTVFLIFPCFALHLVIRNKVADGWRFACFKGIVDPTDFQVSWGT